MLQSLKNPHLSLVEKISYCVKESSICTSSGIFNRISCFMALSSAAKSITRLWTRISHLSYVLVPCPAGDFLVTIFSFFVGKGSGPLILIPALSPIDLISVHTSSSFSKFVLVSFIRACCTIRIHVKPWQRPFQP